MSSNVYGFSKPIEAFGVERYKNNIVKVNIVITEYIHEHTLYYIFCHAHYFMYGKVGEASVGSHSFNINLRMITKMRNIRKLP